MTSPPSDESWKPLNDYSKTIVATAAGFLAFTGTFASDLVSNGARVFISVAWGCLLLTIGAAFLSAAGIVEEMRARADGKDATTARNRSILAANVSYFSFGAAAVLFFVGLLWHGKRDVPETSPAQIVLAATDLVSALDSVWKPTPPLTVRPVAGSTLWEVTYALGTDSVLIVTVASDGRQVTGYHRQQNE